MAKKKDTAPKKKKAGSEKPAFADWAKQNSSKLFLGGMALLLAIRIWADMSESAFNAQPPGEPQTIDLSWPLDEASPTLQKVRDIIQPMPELENSEYAVLEEVSMFDAMEAVNAGQYAQQVNDAYTEAFIAFNRGQQAQEAGELATARQQYNASLQRIAEVLQLQSNHTNALQLRDRVQGRLQQVSEAEAAAAAAQEAAGTPEEGGGTAPPAG